MWLANFSRRSESVRGTLEQDQVRDRSLVPLQVEGLLVGVFLDLPIHLNNAYPS